jgi:hypothetical protein
LYPLPGEPVVLVPRGVAIAIAGLFKKAVLDRVDEAVVAYRQHYGESGLLRSELRELATLFGKCEKPDCEFISPRQSAKRSHVASCSTSN